MTRLFFLPKNSVKLKIGVAGGVVAHLDGVDYWRRNLTPVGV